jgi:hypothetical protein
MIHRKRTILSGLIALSMVPFFLIFADGIFTWLFPSREGILSAAFFLIFIAPGMCTGNGNLHSPVMNNGGFAAAVFTIFFTLCFCMLSIPDLLKGSETTTLIERFSCIMRAAFYGAVACVILMFVSSWIGFFFMSKEDLHLIESKNVSMIAAIVIGLIYGTIAGILVGTMRQYHESASMTN